MLALFFGMWLVCACVCVFRRTQPPNMQHSNREVSDLILIERLSGHGGLHLIGGVQLLLGVCIWIASQHRHRAFFSSRDEVVESKHQPIRSTLNKSGVVDGLRVNRHLSLRCGPIVDAVSERDKNTLIVREQ